MDRVGVIVGRQGRVKAEVEEKCKVALSVDSKTGEVVVRAAGDLSETEPFKAVQVVTAIGKGFSPERAFRLFEDDVVLDIIDLREYAGKSRNALVRIKGRIIGLGGKARRVIEELTETFISVYGHTVAIIGKVEDVVKAREAVEMLATGSPHPLVYKKLQRERRKEKMERLKLWEDMELGK